MLQKIRAGAQTLGAKIVAGLICFVLVVFGFGAFNLFAVSEPSVVKVNGEGISENQLARAVVAQRQNFNRMYGGNLDPEYVNRVITDQSVLRQLINNELVTQKARGIQFASSRKEFYKDTQSNPIFQQDGEFDAEQYARVLSGAGFSAQSYEASALDDRVVEALVRIQGNSSFVTDREIRDASSLSGQTRDVAFVVFESNSFLEGIVLEEEEIQTYYDENADSFMSQEEFEVAYVVLDRSDYEIGINITDEELLEGYNSELAVLESNAERKASHILLNVNESRSLEDAIKQLQAVRESVLSEGASFADIALEISEDYGSGADGGDLGFAGRGTYVPEFEETLFNMEVGEISEPFETEFGVHIIQLHEIAETEHPPFEEREEELRQILTAELATPAYEEAIEELERIAYENVSSLEPVADALGIEIQTQSGVSRGSGEPPFDSYSVRIALLSSDVINISVNSSPIELSESQTLVGRIVSRTEPQLRPLDEVRPRIEGTLKSLEARKRAETQRDAAFDRIDETSDYSAVSNEFNFEWTTQEAIKRDQEGIDREILEAAFAERLVAGGDREILSVDVSPIEFAIVIISRMRPGDYDELPLGQQTTIEESLKEEMENTGLNSFIGSLRGEAKLKFQAVNLSEQP